MTRRLYAFSLMLLAMLAATMWGLPTREDSRPGYRGKPFTFWIKSLSPGVSAAGGFESLELVVDTNAPQYDWHMKWETDTNALPVFVAALGVHNGPVRSTLCWLWTKLPKTVKWRVPVPFNADAVRAKAIDALRRMGEGYARPAIPALIAVLKQDECPLVRQYAVDALANLSEYRLDRNVMEAWVHATRDADPTVRMRATQLLKQKAPALAAQAGVK
jgi:hypothetical protein